MGPSAAANRHTQEGPWAASSSHPPPAHPAPARPPAVRGATLFGQGLLQNAHIQAQVGGRGGRGCQAPGGAARRCKQLTGGCDVRGAARAHNRPPPRAPSPAPSCLCSRPTSALGFLAAWTTCLPSPASRWAGWQGWQGRRLCSRRSRATLAPALHHLRGTTSSPLRPSASPCHPPQWYDTRTMTIIKDTAFVGYK